jgi:hypothetical protein
MLSRRNEIGHLYLAPDLGGKAFIPLYWLWCLLWVFTYGFYYVEADSNQYFFLLEGVQSIYIKVFAEEALCHFSICFYMPYSFYVLHFLYSCHLLHLVKFFFFSETLQVPSISFWVYCTTNFVVTMEIIFNILKL